MKDRYRYPYSEDTGCIWYPNDTQPLSKDAKDAFLYGLYNRNLCYNELVAKYRRLGKTPDIMSDMFFDYIDKDPSKGFDNPAPKGMGQDLISYTDNPGLAPEGYKIGLGMCIAYDLIPEELTLPVSSTPPIERWDPSYCIANF